MKLHLLSYHDDDSGSGTVQEWFTSKRALLARVVDLERNPPAGFQVFDPHQIVTVPTTKPLLTDFLNRYAGVG